MSTDLNDFSFPPEAERKLVSSRVAKRLERIDHLRREISQLQIENTKDRFYISTLRLLPREILSEIFVHAAAGGCGAWLAPMVISHVSQHWRNVVRRTPRAWGSVCIRIVPNSSYSQLLKTWLELSGQSPLHLRFETPLWGTGTREAVRQTSLGSYITLLQPHVSRWHSVEIFIGDTPHHSIWNIQLLLQQFNFDMPALKSFYLDTTRQLWRDYHCLKGGVPKLTRVSIGHCRPSTSNHWLSQLQELEITNSRHSLYYVHGLFKACSSLTSLKLDVIIEDREVRGLNNIILPHLQMLYLSDILCLSFLRLPVLTSFTFVNTQAPVTQDGSKLHASLSMMLEASDNFVLEDLSLTDVDIGRLNFAPVDLPALSKVRLTRCIIRPEALEIWGGSSAWSALRTLEFFSCDRLPVSFLDQFIRGNVWVSALKKLIFFDCFDIQQATITRILACERHPIVAYSPSTRMSPWIGSIGPNPHYHIHFSASSTAQVSFTLPSFPPPNSQNLNS